MLKKSATTIIKRIFNSELKLSERSTNYNKNKITNTNDDRMRQKRLVVEFRHVARDYY